MGLAYRNAVVRIGFLPPTFQTVPKSILPSVCVIMPARNEARDLEVSISSLLSQEGVNLRVIVINDHSSDATGEIAERLSASDERLVVIQNPILREGWFGKSNAMQHGLEACSESVVVFTDADVIHHPKSILTAYDLLLEKQYDFLSLFPKVETRTLWDNCVIPHLMQFGIVRFANRKLEDPNEPDAVAAGAFMMCRRSVLDAIGGLSLVRNEPLDDVMLARAVKSYGFIPAIRFSPELLKVELFKTNWEAFWGFSKNILAAVGPPWMGLFAMWVPLVVYGVPLLAILSGDSFAMLCGFGAWLTQWGSVLQTRRLCELRPVKSLFFPLGAISLFCCFGRALYYRGVRHSVTWRGRVLPIGTK